MDNKQKGSLHIVYPLDSYLQKSGYVKEHLQVIIQKIRQTFKDQFKDICKFHDINLIQTKPYIAKHPNDRSFRQKSGIYFQIQAFFKAVPKLYFQIQKLFKQKSITFLSLNYAVENANIQQLKSIYKQKNMDFILINQITVAIINCNDKNSIAILKSELTKTRHLITVEQFDEAQIKVLNQDNKQVKQYIMKKNFNYQYQNVNQCSFSITCDHQTYNGFLHFAKSYLTQNKKQRRQVKQLQNQFQIFVFMTYFADQVINKFPILSFQLNQGKIYRKNRAIDQDQIAMTIKSKKKQINKKIIKIPSLYKVNSKKVKINKNSFFCMQYLIKAKKYIFLEKIAIKVESIHSLNTHQQNLVFIVKDKAKCHYFKNLLAQNSYKLDNYLSSSNSKRYKGMHQFQLQGSFLFSSILMCCVQTDMKQKCDQQKLSINISQIVQKFYNQKQLNFVFPSDTDSRLIQLFLSLLRQSIKKQRWDRLKDLTIYVQSENQIDFTQIFNVITRTIETQQQRLQIKKQSNFYLYKKNIEKIFFLSFFECVFSNQENLQKNNLSNINSFILSLTNRMTNAQIQIPVFLVKTKQYSKQYLVNLKSGIYYKVDKNCNIQQGKIQSKQQLQRIIKTIKNYFINIHYFVIYEDENCQLIIDKLYYYLHNPHSEVKKLQKVILSENMQIIKKVKNNKDKMILTVIKKQHLHMYQVYTYKDFESEVKSTITEAQFNN